MIKRGSILNNRRGQGTMSLPFGVIFSIFLIIAFIVIAFIAVRYFLDIGNCASVGQFYENLQDKVDEAWNPGEFNFPFKLDAPSGVEKICFLNLTNEITNQEDYAMMDEFGDGNVFLIPSTEACEMSYKLISHLDLNKITGENNPKCFENSGNVQIKKGFYDKLVFIE